MSLGGLDCLFIYITLTGRFWKRPLQKMRGMYYIYVYIYIDIYHVSKTYVRELNAYIFIHNSFPPWTQHKEDSTQGETPSQGGISRVGRIQTQKNTHAYIHTHIILSTCSTKVGLIFQPKKNFNKTSMKMRRDGMGGVSTLTAILITQLRC